MCTLAAQRQPSRSGDSAAAAADPPAIQARFGGIYALAQDKTALYLCDLDNRRIRAVNLKTGMVKTIAGNGDKIGAAGLDGPAEQSQLNRPHGVLRHPRSGELRISDSENHRVIRLQTP